MENVLGLNRIILFTLSLKYSIRPWSVKRFGVESFLFRKLSQTTNKTVLPQIFLLLTASTMMSVGNFPIGLHRRFYVYF